MGKFRMITTDADGKIFDIHEAEKAFFWRKDGAMTLYASRWVFDWTMKGYEVKFTIT